MDSATDAIMAEAQRALKKDQERDKSYSKALSGVAIAASLAGFAGAVGSLVSEGSKLDFLGETTIVQSRSELDNRIIRNIGNLQIEVATLRKTQASVAQLPPGAKTAVQLATLSAKLDAIAQRQDRLEQAIQSNPEKALSMPLMRRDIDNMRDSNAQSVAAIKASVDQVYDLTKWLLGALAVGVFSLAIANFFQRKGDG